MTYIIDINGKIILHDVLEVKGFRYNLLSVGKLQESGNLYVKFHKAKCLFQDLKSDEVIGSGKKNGGPYYLNKEEKIDVVKVDGKNVMLIENIYDSIDSDKIMPSSQTNCTKFNFDILHARLGHASLSKLKHIESCDCSGMHKYDCDVCIIAKHHKFPFNKSTSLAKTCFEVVHIDLWGPYRTKRLNVASYFLTIIDDYSKCTWTYLLHNKGQVHKIVKDFLQMVENQFEVKVKIIRPDNGSEIMDEDCDPLFKEKGII